MAELASVIAIVISLAALWLANSALRHADSSFSKFSNHLAKSVKDAQDDFSRTVTQAQKELKDAERSVDLIERQNQELAAQINSLDQRLKVIEHEINSLTAALPPKYRTILSEKRATGTDN